MTSSRPALVRAAFCLAFGSAVSILFSIAVSQTLLALALAALLLSGAKLRVPPVWLPLALFMVGTLIALALADHPAVGVPQVRKFYVLLMLPLVYSTLRDRIPVRRLFLSWGIVGAATALWGVAQFAQKMQQARAMGLTFYEYYTPERITGAMSHWMTFGGEEMFALLMLGSFLLFGPERGLRRLWPWLLCACLLLVALVLGETRSIWLATLAAGLYLIWAWKRWVVALIPVALTLAVFLGPPSVKDRAVSFFRPRKDVDSNEFRLVTWRTGVRMIEKHPWFGIGPDGPLVEFNDYVPPDIPRPLPSGYYGHLHNIYLQWAADRGIPTMLMMMWLLVQAVIDFWRALRKLPPGPSDARFILRGATAMVIATIVVGFFEYNLGDSEVLTMFLVGIACGYTAIGFAGQKEAAVG
jgi:putative inorganic carbon (HCO3(-)) transporter